MLVRLSQVRLLGGTRLSLRFDEGSEGELDVAQVVPFSGVFAALADQGFFKKVFVDPDWGTLSWPNNLDLAPESLYERITGRDPFVASTASGAGPSRAPVGP
jgi:hypothetical protein